MGKRAAAKQQQANEHAVRDDSRVHAEGSGICGFETLCGYCDTYTNWEEVTEPIDCPGCLDTIRMAAKAVTRV